MFCTKCGHENSDNTVFCCNCGEKLCPEEIVTQGTYCEKQLSITEYFQKELSPSAAKRQSVLKRLLRASYIIQFSLLLMGLLFNLKLLVVPMFFLYLFCRILLGVAFTVGALLLARKGVENKSSGRLFAATPLAFLSICIGTVLAINIPAINIVVAAITVAIHVAMIILNNKDVKEFKEYLIKQM